MQIRGHPVVGIVSVKDGDKARRAFLEMMDSVGERWLQLFDRDPELYSAAYWDLFTRMWAAGEPIRKTEALAAMKGVKSAHTAGKYLDAAIRQGFIRETSNPSDARSKLVQITPWMQARLDEFFDEAVMDIKRTARHINERSPCHKARR